MNDFILRLNGPVGRSEPKVEDLFTAMARAHFVLVEVPHIRSILLYFLFVERGVWVIPGELWAPWESHVFTLTRFIIQDTVDSIVNGKRCQL